MRSSRSLPSWRRNMLLGSRQHSGMLRPQLQCYVFVEPTGETAMPVTKWRSSGLTQRRRRMTVFGMQMHPTNST